MTRADTKTTMDVLLGLIDIPEHIDREEINSDYISELADSIRELGLLQPIILRSVNSRFELIAGHRRFLAHKILGRVTIPSLVKKLTDNEAVLARAVENLQRVDLTDIEEAKVYRAMVDRLGMTVDQIAKKLGKNAGTVHRRISLLSIAACLQEAIHKGQILSAVGEALNKLGNVGRIEYYLGLCIENGVTAAVARAWVTEENAKQSQALLESSGSGGGVVIPRSMPSYVPCDICAGPMSIGSETVIRCCPDCSNRLREVLRQGN